MDDQLDALVQAVLKSPKYSQIDTRLVARIGETELAKGRKLKEAIKATKNKLHQVGGAYLQSEPRYSHWLADLQRSASDPQALKDTCRKVMANHASTRERLPILDDFYSHIFAQLPPITSILDVACGLNPLTLPWMSLSENPRYLACDIYTDLMGFIGAFLDMQPVIGQAIVCDVLTALPTESADLALVLKTIPCLEQVDKRAGTYLLDALNARFIAVSFPAKSLGGREKGMAENYAGHFTQLIDGRGWTVEELFFDNELVFLIQTNKED